MTLDRPDNYNERLHYLVAKYVMGWELKHIQEGCPNYTDYGMWWHYLTFPYKHKSWWRPTHEDGDTEEVLKRLHKLGYDVHIVRFAESHYWECIIHIPAGLSFTARHKIRGHAICLAACLAVGLKVTTC